ncbi:hypothetical protein L6267_04125 [Candidatus Parcubacteria bacterium]|nr:hypothetical protein [Candidatus Parcubacteria bacterium]
MNNKQITTNTERRGKMKFLWIMGICLALLAVFALWDSYKYPVCPKCHDNLRSRRIKGKIVCRIHGAVCILLFFCGAICGNAQEISDAKKFSENLPEYHALVKLAPDVNIYMVTAIDGCHIDILAKRLGIFPRVQDREYSGHAVAFPRNSSGLKQLAEDLAKGDGIITLDELFEVYPK